jgi:RNA polymerase sigma factor (sigma-70 family)
MRAQALSAPAAPRRGAGMRLGGLGDEVLARMVATGSERAFAALYERHHRALHGYCRSIVRSDGDAQDALQSTLAAALVALRAGRRNAPLRPWLFRIAHNESISLLRRRRITVELSDTALPAGSSAEEDAFARLALSSLLSDLAQLGERQRSALVMRELSGLSHADIAIALSTTVGAVKQTIFDARRALIELQEGRAMDCEHVRRLVSDEDRRVLRGRRVRAHLRDCSACAAFASAIPARRDQLQALAVPLAPAAAAALLGHVGQGGAGHGAGALAAGAAGKSAGSALLLKSLIGVAILTTGTLGATRVLEGTSQRSSSQSEDHRPPGAVRVATPRSPGTASAHSQAPKAHRSALSTGHPRGGSRHVARAPVSVAVGLPQTPPAAANPSGRHAPAVSRRGGRARHPSVRRSSPRAPAAGRAHTPSKRGAEAGSPPAAHRGGTAPSRRPVLTPAARPGVAEAAPALPAPGSADRQNSTKTGR